MTRLSILPTWICAAVVVGGGATAAADNLPAAAAQTTIQEAWQAQPATAALGEAGRVVMTYGEAPAALVCAPLHICAIEFGPEETFHDTPSLSDPVRWQMELREGYAGGARRQYLILKPSELAEEAILTAFTDKRFYSIRLVPDDSAYTPILSFRFPDDEIEAARAAVEAARQAQVEAEAAAAAQVAALTARTGVPTPDGLVSAGDLNFDYAIAGDAGFAPQRIYDDGERTYIELPRSWTGEFPVFLAGDGRNTDRVVNYRVDGRRYEIEGVWDAAALRLGRDEIRIRRE
ncbi:MAG: TrbG/VirB9 family P-type conjugative transfer protein [Gemmatimonadota bacterium]|nr:TrbG/VirB9 family P-type conjugative transfer protein [Gemmatimonadota bacterium]